MGILPFEFEDIIKFELQNACSSNFCFQASLSFAAMRYLQFIKNEDEWSNEVCVAKRFCRV